MEVILNEHPNGNAFNVMRCECFVSHGLYLLCSQKLTEIETFDADHIDNHWF